MTKLTCYYSGGRAEFKWTDVQADQHRENYLGHSVMAPVGRWQKGKDLQWYSRNDDSTSDQNDGLTEEERARKERQQEIDRVKLAEREAMNKALGYEINPDGPMGDTGITTGANSIAVVGDKSGRNETREVKDVRKYKEKRRRRSRDRDDEHRHRHRRHRSRSRSRSTSRDDIRRGHYLDKSRRGDKDRDNRDRDGDRYKTRRSLPERRQTSRSLSRDANTTGTRHQRARSGSRSPYRKPDARERGSDNHEHKRSHRRSRSPR